MAGETHLLDTIGERNGLQFGGNLLGSNRRRVGARGLERGFFPGTEGRGPDRPKTAGSLELLRGGNGDFFATRVFFFVPKRK